MLLVWPRRWEARRLARVVPVAGALTLDGGDDEPGWCTLGAPLPVRSVDLARVAETPAAAWLDGCDPAETVVPYFASDGLERACLAAGRACCSAPAAVQWALEDKALFREGCEAYGCRVPGSVMVPANASFGDVATRVGSPFVAQDPHSSAGEGTWLVADASAWAAASARVPGGRVLCSVHGDGVPVCVHVLVGDGTQQVLGHSFQIIGRSGGGFRFLGSEFRAGDELSPLQQRQACAAGAWAASKGFRGVCGVDMLVSGGDAIVLELNPRLQASTCLLTEVEAAAGRVPVLKTHLGHFRGSPAPPRPSETPGTAAQVACVGPVADRAVAGVHRIEDGALCRVRDGIGLGDLRRDDEIVVWPEEGAVAGGVSARWLTRRRVLDDFGERTAWARRVDAALRAGTQAGATGSNSASR